MCLINLCLLVNFKWMLKCCDIPLALKKAYCEKGDYLKKKYYQMSNFKILLISQKKQLLQFIGFRNF